VDRSTCRSTHSHTPHPQAIRGSVCMYNTAPTLFTSTQATIGTNPIDWMTFIPPGRTNARPRMDEQTRSTCHPVIHTSVLANVVNQRGPPTEGCRHQRELEMAERLHSFVCEAAGSSSLLPRCLLMNGLFVDERLPIHSQVNGAVAVTALTQGGLCRRTAFPARPENPSRNAIQESRRTWAVLFEQCTPDHPSGVSERELGIRRDLIELTITPSRPITSVEVPPLRPRAAVLARCWLVRRGQEARVLLHRLDALPVHPHTLRSLTHAKIVASCMG